MSEMVIVTLQKKPHGVFASAIYRVDKGYEVTEAPET